MVRRGSEQLLIFDESQLGAQRGREYLDALPLELRRASGQVYTPTHLVQFILDRLGYAPGALTRRSTVLDPACGAGVFLAEVVQRMAADFLVDRSSARGWTARQTGALLRSVERSVYGVDIDETACEITKGNLRRLIEALTGRATPASFFEKNIVRADFLRADLPSGFPCTFDLIVGNPPYVPATRIAAADKEALRDHYRTAFGRLDLYTLFLERSLALLTAGGGMAFVTPDKYLVTRTSQPLRELLLQRGFVKTVARFRSHRVFESAATVPCVTVFGATNAPLASDETSVLECEIEDDRRVVVCAETKIRLSDFGSGPWHLSQQAGTDLAERIEARHRTLQSVATRISAGIATGLDGVFVLSSSEAAAAGIESGLLRPAVRGRDLQAFRIGTSGLQILIPYSYEAGEPRLIELAAYPAAKRHLATHRSKLEKRHCVRIWEKRWYDVHDPIPGDLARTPKILVPDIAASNRFVFDKGDHCPLHSAYYIVPNGVDPEYLTAILNSRPIEFLIRLRAPVVKDGFSRYRRQFLLPLPIPEASPRNQRRIVSASLGEDNERYQQVVADLFGLSARDTAELDRLLAERGASVHRTPS